MKAEIHLCYRSVCVQIDTNRALTFCFRPSAEVSAYVLRIAWKSEHAPEAHSHPEAELIRPLLRRRPEVRNTTAVPGLTRRKASDSIRCCVRMVAISTPRRSGLSPRMPTACSLISAGPTTAGLHIALAAAAWPYTVRRRRFRCSEPECRAEFSVTSGTVFANRKLSFKKIIMAIWGEISAAKGMAETGRHGACLDF